MYRSIVLSAAACLLCMAHAAVSQPAAAAGAAVANPNASPARSQDDRAAIRHFYDGLLATMKQGTALGFQGREAQLEPLVKKTFALPFMLQLIVGPQWNAIDQTRQDAVLAAFTHWVVANYASQFAEYSGEKFEVEAIRDGGKGTLVVETRIVPSDGDAVPLGYRMLHRQVIDVYLNGSVSQLALWRSQFASVIRKDGVDGLVDRLRRQTEKLAKS